MRSLLRALAPDTFEDVSAVLALYRPGPMAQNWHTEYAERKNGRRPVSFDHPDLEEILADEDLTAGDFIRNCKQTIDLLRQLREAAEKPELREALGRAVDGLNRGVVAYAGAI